MHKHFYKLLSFPLLLQSPTQQHYSTYDEAHLKPIMQHIAKNVVSVNEGLSKHVVSTFLLVFTFTLMDLADSESKLLAKKERKHGFTCIEF